MSRRDFSHSSVDTSVESSSSAFIPMQIPVRHIVLWHDVLDLFPTATNVLHGNAAIPRLRDSSSLCVQGQDDTAENVAMFGSSYAPTICLRPPPA
ncbi:MAG: hypothetical protein J3R72DRAFT_488718 [Linnemannia gamsii]|nr:MAG: hypothetical protein J3R72DRAFT_488718 [Linnemannia gamsii]